MSFVASGFALSALLAAKGDLWLLGGSSAGFLHEDTLRRVKFKSQYRSLASYIDS